MTAGGLIPDPCGLPQPMECHVHHQRADHTALRSSLLGWREDPVLDRPGRQPARDHVAGGEGSECGEKPGMIDFVERRRQVGVYDPHPLALAFQRGEQRSDRIGAAAARSESIRLGFEPGLPFGFQRVADPRLMAAVGERGNAKWAVFSVGLRDIHAPAGTGCQVEIVWCTRTAISALPFDVSATCPSIPAVRRPALRCVTCRTLTSVFDQDRSIIF
jgi:hypothetical protein